MRTLHEQDREEILCYVGQEPEMNLFFIGDIESFGVENETVNIYLHEERDRWDFLILRFHQYFLLYSRYEDYNAQEAIESKKVSGRNTSGAWRKRWTGAVRLLWEVS